MHELICPRCNTASKHNLEDYLFICTYCSVAFSLEKESGNKHIFNDHFIIPNTTDIKKVKELATEWLRRIYHKPSAIEKEFFITNIEGFSIPYWIISLEIHTAWKGLVEKQQKSHFKKSNNNDYIIEKGVFRRSYRWSICARENLAEVWGILSLHSPQEPIDVEWDGFPLDSTFSRGQLEENDTVVSAYNARNNFEFKYANGIPVFNIQVDEQEALRRTKEHLHLYHFRLSQMNVDILTDHRNEEEIAGIQLIHLPFWHIEYIYQPKSILRHFYVPKPKNILINGYSEGILKGELAMV